MEVDAVLCDHAVAADGKLYINGAGVSICWVLPEPPHQVALFLGVIIQVPYTSTNQAHTLGVTLLDEDGNVVVPWQPEGADPPPPVQVTAPFNLGRPPGLPAGEAQTLPVALGFQLAVPHLGAYAFVIEIDGTEVRRLPLRVMTPPVNMAPTIGGVQPAA
jgi:hypothetical protein